MKLPFRITVILICFAGLNKSKTNPNCQIARTAAETTVDEQSYLVIC